MKFRFIKEFKFIMKIKKIVALAGVLVIFALAFAGCARYTTPRGFNRGYGNNNAGGYYGDRAYDGANGGMNRGGYRGGFGRGGMGRDGYRGNHRGGMTDGYNGAAGDGYNDGMRHRATRNYTMPGSNTGNNAGSNTGGTGGMTGGAYGTNAYGTGAGMNRAGMNRASGANHTSGMRYDGRLFDKSNAWSDSTMDEARQHLGGRVYYIDPPEGMQLYYTGRTSQNHIDGNTLPHSAMMRYRGPENRNVNIQTIMDTSMFDKNGEVLSVNGCEAYYNPAMNRISWIEDGYLIHFNTSGYTRAQAVDLAARVKCQRAADSGMTGMSRGNMGNAMGGNMGNTMGNAIGGAAR